MINKTLFLKEWKTNWKMLVLFAAILTLYGAMIVSMFDPKLGESLKMMMESMPQIFSAFGMANPGTTLLEFLINYLYGFLFIAFPVVYIILLANRLMSCYIDRGAMACLLATPNSRGRHSRIHASGFISKILVLVLYLTALCTAISCAMFPGDLEIGRFLAVNAGLFGLLLFLSGLCFFCAAVFSDSKMGLGAGGGLCVVFILIQMLSDMGGNLEKLQYFTPLTLFCPEGLAAGNSGAVLACVMMYAIGFAIYGAGIWGFCRRDLPV